MALLRIVSAPARAARSPFAAWHHSAIARREDCVHMYGSARQSCAPPEGTGFARASAWRNAQRLSARGAAA